MKQHEWEYFTSRIRSGIYRLNFENLLLKVRPITLEQSFELQEKALIYYGKIKEEGFLTNDEILEQMKERGLWTQKDEDRIEGLEKDIERLKVELFQNRNKKQLVGQIRKYLKAGKEQHLKMMEKKYALCENSCEGVLYSKKIKDHVSFCCYKETDQGEELYDFKEIPKDSIAQAYNMQMLGETALRELARSDPWKSSWILHDTNTTKLFSNKEGTELTPDQKNLLIWSKMYDNVQESMECPTEDVIEDDDMLDGWFVLQRKQREKDRTTKELEQATNNPKIAQSDEIFVFTDNQESANKINQSNTFHAQHVKKQRDAVINAKGEAQDLDFQDQQVKMRAQQNEMYKNKFRR